MCRPQAGEARSSPQVRRPQGRTAPGRRSAEAGQHQPLPVILGYSRPLIGTYPNTYVLGVIKKTVFRSNADYKSFSIDIFRNYNQKVMNTKHPESLNLIFS